MAITMRELNLMRQFGQLQIARQELLQALVDILRLAGKLTPEEQMLELAKLVNQQPELTLPVFHVEQPSGQYLPDNKKEPF